MSLRKNVQGESAEYREGDIFPANPFFPGFKKPVFRYEDWKEPAWLDPDREIEVKGEKMNKDQLRDLIARVLKEAGLYSESAVELLMLTAATESNLGEYIRQVRGPALGIFQMEPTTHDDIWENYLAYKDALRYFDNTTCNTCSPAYLEFDLSYSIIMARIHYLRVPSPLPPADNVEALAGYWKKHYNTYLGAGTVEKAIEKYERYAV